MEVADDGGGVGKGGTVTLYLDGDKVGEGRVERTHWGTSRWTRRRRSAATPAHP
jgi:hypothetical protein